MPRTTLPLLASLLLLTLSTLTLVPEAATQAVSAEAVDALFTEWDQPDSPGCALAVIHEGEIVYKNGYGMANLEHGVPITPTTVFYSGSVSKQFVALSIALLAEQGKLSFDDDLRSYLPEIPEYDRTITIRHLIHHTSGLRDYLQLGFLAGRSYLDSMAEEEVLALIARQDALNFSPGDQYLYSNSGYFLLAQIVERASGQTLREFARDHLLGPLGMHDSHFHDDNTRVVPRRADGYFKRDDGGWGVMTMRFALVGSGGLYTSVEDLFRWDQNFYHNTLGAGTQALIDTTLTRGLLTSGDTLSYAFALGVGSYRGLKTVGHGGSLGGYRADLKRFPEQQFATAILCNVANVNPGALANQVADLYLAEVLAPAASASASETRPEARTVATVDPAIYDDYAGKYADESGLVISMTREGSKLMVDWPGYPPIELFPESETMFFQHVDEDRFVFEREASGDVAGLTVHRGARQIPFTRVPVLTARDLAVYVGVYYSDELQVTYTLSVKEEQLFLQIRSGSPTEMTPSGKDKSTANVGSMAFERDAEGMVTGFVLQSGRVRNLRFVKQ